MKIYCRDLPFVAVSLFTVALALPAFGQMQGGDSAAAKSWLLALSPSQFASGRFEVNLKNQGSIGLEGGYMGAREQLREDELEASPGDSMMESGREYKIMVSRFSQPTKMAGFFWGLGVGQRSLQVDWRKSPYEEAPDQFAVADEEGKVNHRLNVTGTLVEGRAGYRYVADMGFVAGIYLNVSHHNNRVTDRDSVIEAEPGDHIGAVADHDAYSLSRRLTSSISPRLEFGWAF